MHNDDADRPLGPAALTAHLVTQISTYLPTPYSFYLILFIRDSPYFAVCPHTSPIEMRYHTAYLSTLAITPVPRAPGTVPIEGSLHVIISSFRGKNGPLPVDHYDNWLASSTLDLPSLLSSASLSRNLFHWLSRSTRK